MNVFEYIKAKDPLKRALTEKVLRLEQLKQCQLNSDEIREAQILESEVQSLKIKLGMLQMGDTQAHRNLVMALSFGLITWLQFFEQWRKL
jgi:hypothetical protein